MDSKINQCTNPSLVPDRLAPNLSSENIRQLLVEPAHIANSLVSTLEVKYNLQLKLEPAVAHFTSSEEKAVIWGSGLHRRVSISGRFKVGLDW